MTIYAWTIKSAFRKVGQHETKRHFSERSKRFIAQFSAFPVVRRKKYSRARTPE
jgi:hypothetical protein